MYVFVARVHVLTDNDDDRKVFGTGKKSDMTTLIKCFFLINNAPEQLRILIKASLYGMHSRPSLSSTSTVFCYKSGILDFPGPLCANF